jgi:predicted DNA-binding transcriptional regulator AlpA
MDTVQANVTGKKAGTDKAGTLASPGAPRGPPEPVDQARRPPITITIKTAMELSGLSRPTINRRIWSGELKTTHVGSRHLIFFDSFQKMLGIDQTAG